MGEMSLERVAEVLSEHHYGGYDDWRVTLDDAGDRCVESDDGGHAMWPGEAAAMAEKLERDAAPPADAGEGGELTGVESGILAGFQVMLMEVVKGAEEGDVIEIQRDGDRTWAVSETTIRTALSAIDKLRALLAAAERGGGPGPATRKVLEAFVRPDYPDWEGLAMVNVAVWRDTKGGETITFDDLRAAFRECGMTEAPR